MPPRDIDTSPDEETVGQPDGSPVAVADYGAVGAGLDALELPTSATGDRTTADRLRWIARTVLPPILAIVVLIAIWQALWAAAFWPEYQLPSPSAVGSELWSDITSGAVFGQLWVSVHRA